MEFVSFLPGDNQDLAAAQAIELINQDLGQLLRLPPQQFWQVVVTDKSLHTCLDSFLRFRRRCYDESTEAVQGSSDLLLQLSQRVFRVFWRMVHPQEPNSTNSSSSGPAKSPPAAAAAAAGSKPAPPSPQQVAELLYNRWLLDVPKMMDLAVLYGPGSSSLTGQLLSALLLLQPKYAQDILTLAEPLSGNLHEVGSGGS
ncbi:hypothetical protein OEZ85_009427 [Tetradesmus obliquus]|uniref:Uncharacterized protein n=1 Tax=Tetradesmus obliquus TaxID=3088 RepID=A0ABY8U8Y7_TETOB|nr:hypothetical protein OEZ85_009427 [Tetradesmus obliquus]